MIAVTGPAPAAYGVRFEVVRPVHLRWIGGWIPPTGVGVVVSAASLEGAAAADAARFARGYGRRTNPECGRCRGSGIRVVQPDTSRYPAIVHCRTCAGRGWTPKPDIDTDR